MKILQRGSQPFTPTACMQQFTEFLGKNEDIECRLACLDDPEHGLTDDVLTTPTF